VNSQDEIDVSPSAKKSELDDDAGKPGK